MHAACVAFNIVTDMITLINSEYKEVMAEALFGGFQIFDFVEQVTILVLIGRTDEKFLLLYDMEAHRREYKCKYKCSFTQSETGAR